MMAILQTHRNKLLLWTGAKSQRIMSCYFPIVSTAAFIRGGVPIKRSSLTREVEPPLTFFLFFSRCRVRRQADWIAAAFGGPGEGCYGVRRSKTVSFSMWRSACARLECLFS